MRFWKIFAWIALGWALIMRRGAGVLVKKKGSTAGEKADASESQSGKGWRRVSTSAQYPARKAQAPSKSSEDAARSNETSDRSGER